MYIFITNLLILKFAIKLKDHFAYTFTISGIEIVDIF